MGASGLGAGGERGKRSTGHGAAEAEDDDQSELLSHSGTPFFPIALAFPLPFHGAAATIGSVPRSVYIPKNREEGILVNKSLQRDAWRVLVR